MSGRERALLLIAIVACPLLIPSSAAPGEAALSPIFGVGIPQDYRHWELIGVSHETGLDELRGILANSTAVEAYRAGTLPFPDGSILVKLAWKHAQSAEFSAAFVPGPATTVQVMVKDAKRYSDTGGWGFGRFVDGRPVDKAQHETCFGCHAAGVKGHDYVFTRLAP
jgi:Cytochrome P460